EVKQPQSACLQGTGDINRAGASPGRGGVPTRRAHTSRRVFERWTSIESSCRPTERRIATKPSRGSTGTRIYGTLQNRLGEPSKQIRPALIGDTRLPFFLACLTLIGLG